MYEVLPSNWPTLPQPLSHNSGGAPARRRKLLEFTSSSVFAGVVVLIPIYTVLYAASSYAFDTCATVTAADYIVPKVTSYYSDLYEQASPILLSAKQAAEEEHRRETRADKGKEETASLLDTCVVYCLCACLGLITAFHWIYLAWRWRGQPGTGCSCPWIRSARGGGHCGVMRAGASRAAAAAAAA